MLKTKYSDVKPIDNFDWDLYKDGYNGTNLVKNKNIKAQHGEVVYCHEKYAEETYQRMEAKFSGNVYTPKDQVAGATYTVTNISPVSEHELLIDTNGGMSAIVDMNKETKFINMLGCDSVPQFMLSLKSEANKEIILQHAQRAKVASKRVSLWEGLKSRYEEEFMSQLNEKSPKYGYTAKVISVNNGGYNVEVNGVTCFLPGSLAASGPVKDFDALVGSEIPVCIVNYSNLANSFVVSHKKYLELTLPTRVENEIVPGKKVYVKVTGQSKNGLFCAIRDDKGEYPFASLMHRTTMSPDMEASFDRKEFVIDDQFYAYVHRVDWDEDGKYRIVLSDQKPTLNEKEENND